MIRSTRQLLHANESPYLDMVKSEKSTKYFKDYLSKFIEISCRSLSDDSTYALR